MYSKRRLLKICLEIEVFRHFEHCNELRVKLISRKTKIFDSWIKCKDPSSSADHQQCEDFMNSKFATCLQECSNDVSCQSQCSRVLDNNLKQCPCKEGNFLIKYWNDQDLFMLPIWMSLSKLSMQRNNNNYIGVGNEPKRLWKSWF